MDSAIPSAVVIPVPGSLRGMRFSSVSVSGLLNLPCAANLPDLLKLTVYRGRIIAHFFWGPTL